ncbi:sugar phosphate isomerase/epimerase [Jeotgalibacillus sp. S-D1]|uniref:sugar phosphate isomerase/epimerase family protein n=1 Tax=Jeotgalibacillus sp. S-D1 TaxID=2552189 RepID=UPI00105AAC01|nr:sugar phosphate isomerase/epimerase family protein [Jeotgalibacillus sp. S-D1]TDL32733.1 sugar phosphate isomerase/epimerase [Jeotgalibacillus sp. S-D1]
MKLAFTTSGCPNWNLDTLLSKAIEYGYDGIDFCGYMGEKDIFQLPIFTTDLAATKKKFQEASIAVSCFSSSAQLFTNSKEELAAHLDELSQYGRLCHEFHTPYIRIFGGAIGDTDRREALAVVSENLSEMLKIAEQYQVFLLLETHDDWTDSEFIEDVLNLTESNYLHVIWNIHEPYRKAAETPEAFWEKLGKRIKYTRWKDSFENTEQASQFCLMGEGDMPFTRFYQLLLENEYKGYFAIEWDKMTYPELAEPEIAFKQFAEYLRELKEKME